jgi:hypothetical protein
MELNWVVGAFTISVAASALTEFSSRRWLQHH